MKITLVMAPSWSRVKPPIALALLSANLKKHGHEVSVLDLNNQLYLKCGEGYREKWEKEEDINWVDKNFVNRFFSDNRDLVAGYVEQILSYAPDIIGFSVYFTNQLASLEIARLIKEKDQSRVIVFGGPQCMRQVGGMDIIKNDHVDAIVVNEGDQTLAEVAGMLEKKGMFEFCPGVLFKKDGEVFDCGDRDPIADIDSLPFADFSGFDLREYERPHELPILASRGCVWGCLFCTARLPWQKYRSQSAERTFEEIKFQLEKYPQVKQITFHDCLVNGDISSLDKFCQLVIEEKKNGRMKDFIWWAQGIIRPEMSLELLQKMKLSGCDWMTYGIESGSEKVTSLMGKKYSPDTASEVVRNTHEAGICLTAIFMFGFPGEKEEDFECTLKFLERNREYFDGVIPADGLCVIERHSALYKNAERFGLYLNPHPFFWQTRDGDNNYPERFGRFERFCQRAEELKINLTGSFDKNRRHKKEIIKEYEDYRDSVSLNICGSLVEREKKGEANFIWELHNKCGLDCLYCRDKNGDSGSFHVGLKEWGSAWKEIYDDYGPVRITIKGGEPLIYQGFLELARELASLHKLEIHTSLPDEFPIEEFDISPGKAVFRLNFHFCHNDPEKFLEKAGSLSRLGYLLEARCLAHPAQLKQIPGWIKKFEDKGLSLKINAFWGEYGKKNYPDEYTEEELEILRPYLGDSARISYNLRGESPKGKLCNAGYKWCLVGQDGRVSRCGFSPETGLGSILDGTFRLFDQPHPCGREFCPYNEFDTVVK